MVLCALGRGPPQPSSSSPWRVGRLRRLRSLPGPAHARRRPGRRSRVMLNPPEWPSRPPRQALSEERRRRQHPPPCPFPHRDAFAQQSPTSFEARVTSGYVP